MIEYKVCTKCSVNKHIDEYYIDKNQKYGRKSQCKVCKSEYSKLHNAKPDVKHNNKSNKRQYYINNMEKEREYRVVHSVHIKHIQAQWYQNNKVELSKHRYLYCKERLSFDLNFKLTKYLRTRLNYAVKNNQKVGSAVDDLGCSIDKFKIHLQLKFHRNSRGNHEYMTWDNYGEWHIDHIKPLSKFDLTNKVQFLEAAHFTNLQPLWAIDNMIKSNH